MTITRTPGRGYLTPAQLVVVDTGRNGPQSLRVDAAAQWRAWLAQGMPPACLTSGYRSWSAQAELRADYEAGTGGMADTPEWSWHPDGIAADVAEPARSWLRRHGGPAAVFDTVRGEPWHVLISAPAGAPSQEVDDMTRDELLAVLRAPEFDLRSDDRAWVTITGWYVDLLGRAGSPAEIAPRVADVVQGRTTYAQQYAAIFNSAEARARRERTKA